MKRILILVVVACLFGACHNLKKATDKVEEGYAEVSGTVVNYKSNKVVVQIFGNDTVVSLPVDEKGNFKGRIFMKDFAYARVCSGNKAAVPAYLAPNVELNLQFDVALVNKGDFNKVKVTGKNVVETKMMVDYYKKQLFPASQELFVLNPVDFKQKMIEVSAHNEKVINDFVAKNKSLDNNFVDMFKIQVQVPLAVSYFYYPMYHQMFCPKDKSKTPEDFNIFDKRLPKNDMGVYTKVYRYKTYEVSYWNNLLLGKVAHLQGDMVKFFNTYIDELKNLELNQMIKDDVANNLVMQNYKGVPENIKSILKARYKEIVKNEAYISHLDKMMK